MRLLLVEDDVFLGSSLSYFLSREGYEVDWAQCGSEVLELAYKKRHALMILDLNLPDISGLEVLRNIRQNKMDMFIYRCFVAIFLLYQQYFSEIFSRDFMGDYDVDV